MNNEAFENEDDHSATAEVSSEEDEDTDSNPTSPFPMINHSRASASAIANNTKDEPLPLGRRNQSMIDETLEDEFLSQSEKINSHIPFGTMDMRHQKLTKSYQNAVNDMSTHLDHVIAIGNQIIHDAHKRNVWMKRLHDNNGSVNMKETEMTNSRNIIIHAEDTLLYSRLKNVQHLHNSIDHHASRDDCMHQESSAALFQWPVDYNDIVAGDTIPAFGASEDDVFASVNDEFERYYGDGVNEQDFQTRRYRKRKRTEISGCSHHNVTDISDDTSGSVVLQDVIRRAWDKAMHIASNTLAYNVRNAEDQNTTQHSTPQTELFPDTRSSSDEHKEEITDRSTQAKSVLKCKELRIEFDPIYIPDDDPYYKCQCCKKRIKYHSNALIISHLYGSIHKQGCCWNAIREKQEQIVRDIMEREAMNIVDNLLQIVFKTMKQKMDRSSGDRPIMTWLDVCNTMTATLNMARDPQMTKHVEYQELEKEQMAQIAKQQNQSVQVDETMDDPEGRSQASNNREDIRGRTKLDSSDGIGTLQIDHDLMPFTLSRDVMKVSLSRLIERYHDGNTQL